MAAYPKGKNDVETMDTITNTIELINETIEKMRRIFFIYNLLPSIETDHMSTRLNSLLN